METVTMGPMSTTYDYCGLHGEAYVGSTCPKCDAAWDAWVGSTCSKYDAAWEAEPPYIIADYEGPQTLKPVAQPIGGTKFDTAKPRLDLLPVEALAELAEVLTFGAQKYGDHNWRSGLKYSRLFAATLRHLFDWARGIDKDPETGKPHLAHAGCNILFLLTFRNNKALDDRYKDIE